MPSVIVSLSLGIWILGMGFVQRLERCGVGAEVCYRIQKNIFDALDAPIIRVSQEDVPMPYNERLEHAVLPNADKLIAAVKQVCYA